MRSSTLIGRIAGVAAVAVAVVAVAIILLSGGSTYTVNAVFQNASQIVVGDQVDVAGNPIGSVAGISLTPNGQANLKLTISDSAYQPLRQGTLATVRQASLSGIANRYVDLRLGPAKSPAIPDNGVIPTQDTASAVDFDELFDALNPPTRKGLQDVIQGSAAQFAGKGSQANVAFQYLNPAIASSSVLFSEINRDTAKFTNFIVKSSNLVGDLSTRSSDLTGLVQNLSTTFGALAAQRAALGTSIQRLPGFMRLANTTFVNLRSALDDLKPLVDASKPVAPKLNQLLVQLRPLAYDAVPTVRDLSNIIQRPGPNNDLIELTGLGVPLAAVTVHNVTANGKSRPGAFPESVVALNDSTPELAVDRPYAVDLTGWFEGFSHPGIYDANGGISRVAPGDRAGLDRNRIARSLLDGRDPGPLDPRRQLLHRLQPPQQPRRPPALHAEQPGHRAGRSLPGLDGARRALVSGVRLPLHAQRGTDRIMRRILLSAAILLAAAAFIVIAGGASSSNTAQGTYKIEFDNAFGLVNGADFKVAGVPAGTIKSITLDQKTLHALVTIQVTQPGLSAFHADASCESRPQSLIGEYFIDCQPGTKGPVLKTGSTIPVQRTLSTIPADLIQNINQMPYRERLTLIINELGAAVAARSEDLQSALQRADPAIGETDNLLNLLANDAQTIKQLNVNADAVITALANNSAQVQKFIVEANNTAGDTATQASAFQATWAKLPGFLQQLHPAMTDLDSAVTANEPVLANLNTASSQLHRFFIDAVPFSHASLPALTSLGKAAVTGKSAVQAATPLVANLNNFAKPTPELAQNLAIVGHDLDDRSRAVEPDPRSPGGQGFTGLEALLQYAFNQTTAISYFGQFGHELAVDAFVSKACSPYATTTSIASNLKAYQQNPSSGENPRDCYAWLGPNQPGVTTPDPTAGGACIDPGAAPTTYGYGLKGETCKPGAAADTASAGKKAAKAKSASTAAPQTSTPSGTAAGSGGGGGGSGGSSSPGSTGGLTSVVGKIVSALTGGTGSGSGSGGLGVPSISSSTPANSPSPGSQTQQLLNYLLAP